MMVNNHTFPKVTIPDMAYAGQPGLRGDTLTLVYPRKVSPRKLDGTIAYQLADGTFEEPKAVRFNVAPLLGFKPGSYPYLQATVIDDAG